MLSTYEQHPSSSLALFRNNQIHRKSVLEYGVQGRCMIHPLGVLDE